MWRASAYLCSAAGEASGPVLPSAFLVNAKLVAPKLIPCLLLITASNLLAANNRKLLICPLMMCCNSQLVPTLLQHIRKSDTRE